MIKIDPEDLVAFDGFSGTFPIVTDPVYAKADHPENLFGQIYHPKARIWGHRDLVKIVLLAATRLYNGHGWTLAIKDCLRPVEAQEKIAQADISKANPQWFEEPRFMSPPGKGAHPRGMAVDVAVDGIDMGTAFDSLTPQAARDYKDLPDTVLKNRKILEVTMVGAARDLGFILHPLSNEWWDFRFMADAYNLYEPLSEDDLWPHQKMMEEPSMAPMTADAKTLNELRRFI